ncbi:MAG: 4Fe-4S binding protein [Candidatus Cloacimonetes bacterium]|nr:4Fe-4S binding protein [Candidatus Cloacimonadota bacterium]
MKNSQGKIIKESDSLYKIEVAESIVDDAGDFKETPVHIYYEWCKKCGICVAFCPTGALANRDDGAPYVIHPEKCTHCERCDMLCPDYAITGAAKSERKIHVKK